MKKENIPAYEVLKQENLTDIHSTGYLVRHKKTGARLVLIENDDENKVFSIAFRPHLLTFSPVLYNSGSSTYALSRPRQRSGPSLNYSITHQNRQVFEAPLKNSD